MKKKKKREPLLALINLRFCFWILPYELGIFSLPQL